MFRIVVFEIFGIQIFDVKVRLKFLAKLPKYLCVINFNTFFFSRNIELQIFLCKMENKFRKKIFSALEILNEKFSMKMMRHHFTKIILFSFSSFGFSFSKKILLGKNCNYLEKICNYQEKIVIIRKKLFSFQKMNMSLASVEI